MGCSPWGRKELGTTKQLTHTYTQPIQILVVLFKSALFSYFPNLILKTGLIPAEL